MRPSALVATALAALSSAGTALAGAPADGYVVFKTLPGGAAVTEYRAKTGQVVGVDSPVAGEPGSLDPCRDPSFVDIGRWHKLERYWVNVASTPSELNPSQAARDLVAAHEGWEKPFTTDCPRLKVKTNYRAKFGGVTNRDASLVSEMRPDGANTVAFQSLAGGPCDGAVACTSLLFRDGKVREADMALEKDLARYGFGDYWTTDDLTVWRDREAQLSVSDVATHEFGHWAGLGHTDGSPALTMFPFVHDGAQTLGLGDLLGIAELY